MYDGGLKLRDGNPEKHIKSGVCGKGLADVSYPRRFFVVSVFFSLIAILVQVGNSKL